MGDLFGQYKPVSSEYDNKKIETLAAYEEHYMRLLRNYKNEIKEIEDMMSALRAEREQFYSETLPEIERGIREDKVLSADAAELWISELRGNMERSFAISEQLISHYVTSNLQEFKAKMKKALDRV